jgi:sterol desaturase/sphingolipid hydroxylase (fatty acid hydroxylase superfamily)
MSFDTVTSALVVVAATLISWSFVMYWAHRAAHSLPTLRRWHNDHHAYVLKTVLRSHPNVMTWEWNNIFLFNNTWRSTVDFWITDVIPTLLFVLVTGQVWFGVIYYLYCAFLQESLEHNPKFEMYPFVPGAWHLEHHKHGNQNFGVWFPIWDIVFKTHQTRT